MSVPADDREWNASDLWPGYIRVYQGEIKLDDEEFGSLCTREGGG
jgi:hypothetical protein